MILFNLLLLPLLLEDGVLGGVVKGGVGAGAAVKTGGFGAAGGLGKWYYGGLTDPSYRNAVLCGSDEYSTGMFDHAGVCTSAEYCQSKGGYSSDYSTCGGKGVCCTFEGSCGSTIKEQVASFQSPNYPEHQRDELACNINLLVLPGVTQLRVDFIDFELPAPGPSGHCSATDYFAIYAPQVPLGVLGGRNSEKLCGTNKDQHLYVRVEAGETVQMMFGLSGVAAVPLSTATSLSSGSAYRWNIKITQIEGDSSNEYMQKLEAPEGCLQYFREQFGTITSFNFDGRNKVGPDMDYTVCLEPEHLGHKVCGATIRAVSFGMPVDGSEPGQCAVGREAIGCQQPAVVVASNYYCRAPGNLECNVCCTKTESSYIGLPSSSPQPRFNFCGQNLGTDGTVYNMVEPYTMRVFSGSWPQTRRLEHWAVGFSLEYKIDTGLC